MSSTPEMRSPAPRANAENRANRSSIARRIYSTDRSSHAIDFDAINREAVRVLGPVLYRLLPDGKVSAGEYIALNPRRADKRRGSFKVRFLDPDAGVWCDFATGDKGGDVISLVAYLDGVSQGEAARRLARMLGVDERGRRHGCF